MLRIENCRTWPLAGALAVAVGLVAAVPRASAQADPTQPQTAAEMKAYTETIPGTNLKIEMIPIQGGTYTIGSPADEEGRNQDEGPQRQVSIAPFWMGKFEVTWEEFDQYAFEPRREAQAGQRPTRKSPRPTRSPSPTTPYADMTFGMGKEGYPAICMTQFAAKMYCKWLSAKTGRYYRLPTEAEWEYACRAGTTTAYSFGDDPDEARRLRLVRRATATRSTTRSARRSRIPGACTTCTATWPSGCSTTTSQKSTPPGRRISRPLGR